MSDEKNIRDDPDDSGDRWYDVSVERMSRLSLLPPEKTPIDYFLGVQENMQGHGYTHCTSHELKAVIQKTTESYNKLSDDAKRLFNIDLNTCLRLWSDLSKIRMDKENWDNIAKELSLYG